MPIKNQEKGETLPVAKKRRSRPKSTENNKNVKISVAADGVKSDENSPNVHNNVQVNLTRIPVLKSSVKDKLKIKLTTSSKQKGRKESSKKDDSVKNARAINKVQEVIIDDSKEEIDSDAIEKVETFESKDLNVSHESERHLTNDEENDENNSGIDDKSGNDELSTDNDHNESLNTYEDETIVTNKLSNKKDQENTNNDFDELKNNNNNIVNKVHEINKSKIEKQYSSPSPVNQYNISKNDDIVCTICEQKLDNNLKLHSREPQEGYEEEVAILDPLLSLFNGNEENISKEDIRSYNKLTNFSVYCKNGHLCSFDSGLIEKDMKIFLSGYVKPIYNDDPSIENGVPGINFGPITSWWITGFDMGEEPTIGFSTELGDYILMKPSDEYAPFMQSVTMKILLSKIVIEYLVYTPNATYEDLLSKLQNTKIQGNSLSNFTEDTLLQYAPFICNQVMSFDETSNPDEPLLVVAPCIRRLIDLAGIACKQLRQQNDRDEKSRKQRNYLLHQLTDKQDNPATSDLIDRFLPGDIDRILVASTLRERRRRRCGICDRCHRPACAECSACAHHKQDACVQRRCFYREIQDANDQDTKESSKLLRSKAESAINVYRDTIRSFSCFTTKLSWPNEPIGRDESGNIYYDAIEIDNERIVPGDFVFVHSVNLSVRLQAVRVAYLWEDSAHVPHFHGNYFWWGADTVLGEVADMNELFDINKCCNLTMRCVMKKVRVEERFVPKSWIQTDFSDDSTEVQFYCEKSYDPVTARFQDLQHNNETLREKSKAPYQFCPNCTIMEQKNEFHTPQAMEKLEEKDEKVFYNVIKYRGEEYRPGSCVYLKSKSLYFKYPMTNNPVKSNIVKIVDEEKYPEYYRKLEDRTANLKLHIPAPFDIGYISEIFTMEEKLFIKVKKLYRPENTHRGQTLNKMTDINKLFWSDEEYTIEFSYVVRKCYVSHARNLSINVDEWSNLGPDRFYFTQIYRNMEFCDVDRKQYGIGHKTRDNPKNYPIINPLRTLDIFAGCGGLSLGLQQASLAKCCWAIEPDPSAASTYKLNSPDTVVFIEDCNVILRKVMSGEINVDKGQSLPTPDEVDLVCASFALENFRGMFNISTFKNSPIATFISYCDYYKPLFFILETDESIVAKSIVLKLTLACLVNIGYQVSFNLLQVGNYGAPQNRRRSVILGAAPGQKLPNYPNYIHVFPKAFCQSGIVVDNKMYTQAKDWTESAPYRAVTIRDAISDLPSIVVGSNEEVNNYIKEPVTTFQKMMRKNMLEATVFDHVCKDLGLLVQTRIMHIPISAGSDWRDLPNIEVQMKDGSFTNKLVYNYDDPDVGRSSHGAFRGVCRCCIYTNPNCDLRDRQENTLIPWHLVHSGKRHNHWAGLYSRLQWDGFFPGAITNPEPLGSQGPVLHPSQPRVISVRECARAQGFPDDFTLGVTSNKYRQISLFASPLLALAIGREIASCIKR